MRRWGRGRPRCGCCPFGFRADGKAGTLRPRRSRGWPDRPGSWCCRSVGAIAVQLAREGGGAGDRYRPPCSPPDRARSRRGLFVDLDRDRLEDVGEVDLVFDVFGGRTLYRSAALVRSGGALVSIAEPPRAQPEDGRASSSSSNLIARGLPSSSACCETGGCVPRVDAPYPLDEAAAAFDPAHRSPGKAIIRVIDDVASRPSFFRSDRSSDDATARIWSILGMWRHARGIETGDYVVRVIKWSRCSSC